LVKNEQSTEKMSSHIRQLVPPLSRRRGSRVQVLALLVTTIAPLLLVATSCGSDGVARSNSPTSTTSISSLPTAITPAGGMPFVVAEFKSRITRARARSLLSPSDLMVRLSALGSPTKVLDWSHRRFQLLFPVRPSTANLREAARLLRATGLFSSVRVR